MFNCAICGENFRTRSDFESHTYNWCTECKSRWNCDFKYEIHMNQEHNLECDNCQAKFAKESTLKYHNQVWYCEACDSNFECEDDFIDHVPDLDHYLVKNLRPKFAAKIPLEAFKKSTVKANDNEHEAKVD